ncbi:MAG: hypothetical protein ACRC0S_07325 [Fusobacteriaceae bacterium]
MKVTDRELLGFCNLIKLKLEFSEYKEWDTDNKKMKYRTIRELINLELEGQKNREKDPELEILFLQKKELEKEKTRIIAEITRTTSDTEGYHEACRKLEEWKKHIEKNLMKK